MKHILRCRCGTLQGTVDATHTAGRAVCYCKDCQAFARYLGHPGEVLNPQGGTEVLASLPRGVHLTAGSDQIRCMALSDKGLLRWYAACCRTPIGNTPRDPKTPYIGLVRSILPGPEAAFTQAFGPLKIALNTGGAQGRVAGTPGATFFGVIRIMRKVLGARFSGSYRENPFFKVGTAEPVVVPHNLSAEERQAL